jgi:hypothetical protein
MFLGCLPFCRCMLVWLYTAAGLGLGVRCPQAHLMHQTQIGCLEFGLQAIMGEGLKVLLHFRHDLYIMGCIVTFGAWQCYLPA